MSMAAAGSLKGVGVPVKLLHEAEGHIVTVSKSIRIQLFFAFFYFHFSALTSLTHELFNFLRLN